MQHNPGYNFIKANPHLDRQHSFASYAIKFWALSLIGSLVWICTASCVPVKSVCIALSYLSLPSLRAAYRAKASGNVFGPECLSVLEIQQYFSFWNPKKTLRQWSAAVKYTESSITIHLLRWPEYLKLICLAILVAPTHSLFCSFLYPLSLISCLLWVLAVSGGISIQRHHSNCETVGSERTPAVL